MRYACIAVLSVLLMPALTHAGGKCSFFFGFGGFGYPFYGGCCAPCYRVFYPVYCGPYYRAYSFGWVYRNYGYCGYRGYGYGFGGYSGRYAAPQVYSPSRYGSASLYSGYARDYGYRRGSDSTGVYRGAGEPAVSVARSDRGRSYYGPALERYSRDARNYPSYHYNRREAYISPGRAGALTTPRGMSIASRGDVSMSRTPTISPRATPVNTRAGTSSARAGNGR